MHEGDRLITAPDSPELQAVRSNDLADEAGACAGLALPLPFFVKLQRPVV